MRNFLLFTALFAILVLLLCGLSYGFEMMTLSNTVANILGLFLILTECYLSIIFLPKIIKLIKK